MIRKKHPINLSAVIHDYSYVIIPQKKKRKGKPNPMLEKSWSNFSFLRRIVSEIYKDNQSYLRMTKTCKIYRK